ncbi:Hansenula MRAKII killer toxin-resistant protein 1 [Paractinoplanes durhamensis]|nr:Hansenula MRAKII killer toxin-resistant protein 1 [Actinoplanes durhamensis]
MADKGWTGRFATAAGVAAGTGAAQLGLGYGLGVVVWPVATTTDPSVWLGSLGWATWITASATVFGAIIASRPAEAQAERSRGPLAAAIALCAGVGALVAVALIALPARDSVRLEARSPQSIAAAYALIGIALGVLVAYWAVRSRPVGANLIATAAWLWALAITSIVMELSLHRASATYLTSWQFAEATSGGRYGTIYWPSALLTLGAAFLIGIIAAAPAAGRGNLGLGTATSGAVGPLLVAASFLVLAPRLTGDLGPLESAYLIAPYAVLAGLAGSALTVSAAKALANRRGSASPVAVGEEEPADDPAFAAGSPRRPSPIAATSSPAVPQPALAAAAAAAAAASTPTGRAKLPAQAKPADPAPKPATPSPKADDSAKRDSRPNPTPVAAAKTPTPLNEPPKAPTAVNDPEIAAAARPGRLRGRKATQPAKAPAPKEVRSTVTPPPDAPTVARINPKPTADD